MHDFLLRWKLQVRAQATILGSNQPFNGHLEACEVSIVNSKDLCSSFNLDASNIRRVETNRAQYQRYANRKDLELLKKEDLESMLSSLRWIWKDEDWFGTVTGRPPVTRVRIYR